MKNQRDLEDELLSELKGEKKVTKERTLEEALQEALDDSKPGRAGTPSPQKARGRKETSEWI